MNLFELRKQNSLARYDAILSGVNSAVGLAKATNLSVMTIGAICRHMAKKEIIEMSSVKRDSIGRRPYRYKSSHKYYSYFIDRQSKFFSTIAISSDGISVDRFDYPINYQGKTPQDVLVENVISRIKSNPNHKYCMAIYLINGKDDCFVLDNDIINVNKEEIIAESLAVKNKTSLFDFNGKLIMSLYSRIHIPDVDIDTLCKAIKFDEVYTLRGDLYYETFEALKRIARLNIEKVIM